MANKRIKTLKEYQQELYNTIKLLTQRYDTTVNKNIIYKKIWVAKTKIANMKRKDKEYIFRQEKYK